MDFVRRKIGVASGSPKYVMTENGPYFAVAHFWHCLQPSVNRLCPVSEYASNGIGRMERIVVTLMRDIANVRWSSEDEDWDRGIGNNLLSYGTRKGNNGERPFELIFVNERRFLNIPSLSSEDKVDITGCAYK